MALDVFEMRDLGLCIKSAPSNVVAASEKNLLLVARFGGLLQGEEGFLASPSPQDEKASSCHSTALQLYPRWLQCLAS